MAKKQKGRQGGGQGPATGDEARKQVALNAQQVAQLYENERKKFDALNAQRQSLAGMLVEVDTAIVAIGSVEKSAENEKVMVAVGAGAYLDAAIADRKCVAMSKPGGVVIRVGTKEAKDELLKQKEELDRALQQVVAEQAKAGNSINMWAKIMAEGRRVAAEHAMQKRGAGGR